MPELVQVMLATLSTREAAAAVLASGAAATLVVGFLRAGRGFLAASPGAVFVLLGALPLCPLPPALRPWPSVAVPAAALALVACTALQRRVPMDSSDLRQGATRVAVVYLGAALVVAATLMLHDLGGYAGTLQRWESSVVHTFGQAFARGDAPLDFARDRFAWSSGILSLGGESLLFGAPAYALFHVAGFSAWTLRLPAVAGMLLGIVAVFLLARRFFGPLVAGAAAMLVAANECALFYGRYGSSPAATVLTVAVAVHLVLLFLERDPPAWWLPFACALGLYLATLQYAPGRIVVLILLGFVPLVVACRWRRLSRRRVLGVAALFAAMGLVWWLQGPRGRGLLFSGQGEHFFHMTSFPDYVASFCPECVWLLPDRTAYQVALVRRWLGVTVPEYLNLIGPKVQTAALRDWGAPVFPQLYYGPLAMFVAWGLAHSLRRFRSAPHALLLVWVALATVPLLLTNRVDSHRMMLFLVPTSLWAALGVWEAARTMTRARVPVLVQHLLGVALSLTVVAHDVRLLWGPSPPPSPAARTLGDALARIPGPVAVGALIDPPMDTLRDLEFVHLEMLERQRREPARTATVIAFPLVTALKDGPVPPAPASLAELATIAAGATVVLAPAETFGATAAALRARGARVEEASGPGLRLWRVEGGVPPPPAGQPPASATNRAPAHAP